jgi:membrane protein involved in colicin uptake
MSQADETPTPVALVDAEAQVATSKEDEERAAADAKAADEAAKAKAAADDNKTFDAEYVKSLREEAAKYRTDAKAAADKLKKREDAELGETEKAKKEAKEATERAEKAEAQALRSEVAAKLKLSPSVAARLIGDTKSELEKDAEKLLKDFAGTAGGFDSGAGRGPAPKQSEMNAWIRGSRS